MRAEEPERRRKQGVSSWVAVSIAALSMLATVGARISDNISRDGSQSQVLIDTQARVTALEKSDADKSGSLRRLEILTYRLADKLGVRTDDIK